MSSPSSNSSSSSKDGCVDGPSLHHAPIHPTTTTTTTIIRHYVRNNEPVMELPSNPFPLWNPPGLVFPGPFRDRPLGTRRGSSSPVFTPLARTPRDLCLIHSLFLLRTRRRLFAALLLLLLGAVRPCALHHPQFSAPGGPRICAYPRRSHTLAKLPTHQPSSVSR
ncbi:hypothetical protein LZ30DRAFT_340158 [Colletotrichum cereale]|nr:hypothetical protein LZ30DRAFT_340158 [Colletotrichum cereale]